MTSLLNLCRAEINKILAQRAVAILLLWIWPIGGVLLPLALLVISWFSPGSSDVRATVQWTDVALGTWLLPTNLFGRLLFISLACTIFSGEYEWKTWKLIVPRADRIRLVLAKYIAFTALLTLGVILTSLLLTVGLGIIQLARGLPYPPTPTPDALLTFARDYALEMSLGIVNTLIGVGFGAILATVTRSIVGGIIGGILFIAGEIGFISAVTTLGFALKSPEIAGLSRFTSAINIANVASLVRSGQPVPSLLEGTPTNSLGASFAILGLWLVLLIALNLWLFQRQDLF